MIPPENAHVRYPAIAATRNLSIWQAFWVTSLVHTIWQGWYYVFIMIRRKEKIAAGRPTSFTWLKRSYAKTWIGKWVNSLPEPLQPFSFMGIQVSYLSESLLIKYVYSLLTMIPAPLWFISRIWSAIFLSLVFGWSVWNGATYYVDIFGKRFQKELEDLRAEVEKWQNSPLRLDGSNSGTSTPYREIPNLDLASMEKPKGE